ncbi:MAG: extracellular solute-binding protein, partial [Acetatifactor sp.]|nr:extracellular solute-binding protein [Acetatifactor sp.]
EWIYISALIPGKNGGLQLLLNGENMYRMDVSDAGEISEREQLSEETGKVLGNRQNTMVREDGTMVIIYSDENDWTKSYIATYDPESDTLGESSEMPASFGWNGYGSLNVGMASDLIFTMSDGVYIFNKGDEAVTKKMDFVNSDVNISNFVSLVEVDKDSFVGIFYENYGDDMKAAVFTYRDPADIPDKSVVVLAGNWVDNAIRQRAVAFNRASDTYRIVIREYGSYNSYDDYNAGFTRLNNDIVTGGMPDILLAENLPIENYISKGLIADVGKLIEEDPELSQVEFLQNVFDAYSVDGKLYYVVPNFSVNTMIAKTSLVGDKTGWTLEEMQQTVASMGEGAQAIGELTREGFMNTAMQYCGNDFIDVTTGKCSFNTENFISMMEYAKTLPEELDWENMYNDNYWMTYESQYRENRTLLMQLYISSMDNLKYSLNGNFGEPVTFIGFPTESGKGSYISANQSFVLSAKSANLEGAWEFLRYYLTDEYQNEIEWGLSVNKQIFMERAQRATQKPTYTDENGNEVEYEETFYINGEDIPLDPLSQEQVDQITDFIMSVDRAYYYNESVLNIINEEMGAFYTGQKNAQDVANVIQSRAQIYVDENR